MSSELTASDSLDNLTSAMEHVGRSVVATLDALLPTSNRLEARLCEAMRYAALGAGKRFRPFLVVASADLFDLPSANALRVAAAAELVHCYSLVHDDLPCMDDADLRRGRPSVHKQFNEATAVLAGDGLLSLAFEVLAAPPTHQDAAVRVELVRALAQAAGPGGMVGGQAMDMEAGGAAGGGVLDIGAITRLQHLKTGVLIDFCCEAGAILGHADPHKRQALRAYAHDLGLAYQMTDDLLDVAGASAATGKGVGRDAMQGKATFVSLMGVERARAQALMLAGQAARHLDIFGAKAKLLKELAIFVINRRA
jgi:farnesyl diphosphate synthase